MELMNKDESMAASGVDFCVFMTASGRVKITSKVEGKISVCHCVLLHARQHNIPYFMLHFNTFI